jgi:hypothetical protein
MLHRAVPEGHVVIELAIHGYILDGQTAVQNPIGREARQLEVGATVVTADESLVVGVLGVLERLDVPVHMITSRCAVYSQLVSREDSEQGVMVVDVDAERTVFAVYLQGRLQDAAVASAGYREIRLDTARRLGLRPPEFREVLHSRYELVRAASEPRGIEPGGIRIGNVMLSELLAASRDAAQGLGHAADRWHSRTCTGAGLPVGRVLVVSDDEFAGNALQHVLRKRLSVPVGPLRLENVGGGAALHVSGLGPTIGLARRTARERDRPQPFLDRYREPCHQAWKREVQACARGLCRRLLEDHGVGRSSSMFRSLISVLF